MLLLGQRVAGTLYLPNGTGVWLSETPSRCLHVMHPIVGNVLAIVGERHTQPMSITVHIPAPLRAYCQGAGALSLSAASVRAALEQIERSHPLLYRSVCDETGAVRRHVNLFVNTAHVADRDGLDTALAPGDVLTILPAVSGG